MLLYVIYRTLVLLGAGLFFMFHNHVFTSMSNGASMLLEGCMGGSLIGLGIAMAIEDIKSDID
jgi:hypothetical protein